MTPHNSPIHHAEIPAEISAEFAGFYKKLLDKTIVLNSAAELKEHWAWALREGEGKSISTRQWLCGAMLKMPAIPYDELPKEQFAVVATLMASESFISAQDETNEANRVWRYIKKLVEKVG